MLRTRTDLMRVAFFTALGLSPSACGSKAESATDQGRDILAASMTPTSHSPSSMTPVADDAGVTASVTAPTPTDTQQPVATAVSPAVTAAHSSALPTQSPTHGMPQATSAVPVNTSVPAMDGGSPPVASSSASEMDGGAPQPQADAGAACGMSGPIDPASGLALCSNGVLHRPEATECASSVPRGDVDFSSSSGVTTEECTTDSDCVASPHGYCAMPGQLPSTQCIYGCVNDSECGADEACLCGDPVGQCVKAPCKTDAECDPGLLCAVWVNPNGIGCPTTTALACQTNVDTCLTDNDCADEPIEGTYCSAERGVRSCVSIPPLACGRPFLVQGQERLARLVTGADWCGSGAALDVTGLNAEQRDQLGQRWAELGLMEHASIAAFARFTLQLLHVGAPAELVAASQHAMLDETAHARACFGLAATYLGYPVSAGALPMDHALDATSLPDLVRLTIREGCVGETVAALEAAEAWAHTELPQVRTVLDKIRADELNHAQLAWRFVRWALGTGDVSVRRAIEEEFRAVALESATTAAVSREAFDTLPYGLAPASLRVTLRQVALREVVLPCAAELLRVAPPASIQAPSVAFTTV